MKVGDLVKWSASWLAGCSDKAVKNYRNQLGVVMGVSVTDHNMDCLKVTWSNGKTSDVHRDYLEALCR